MFVASVAEGERREGDLVQALLRLVCLCIHGRPACLEAEAGTERGRGPGVGW